MSTKDCIGDPRVHERGYYLDGIHSGRVQVNLTYGVRGVLMVLEVLREDGRASSSANEAAAKLGVVLERY